MSEIRTAVGAVSTTVACVMPLFLVGGIAVQIADELRFSPAGLGAAVSVYFGVSALASVPAGRLVGRYGSAATARVGIALAAAGLLAISVLARSLVALIMLLAASAAANALGQLASNDALARRISVARQGLSFGVMQSAIPASTLLAGAVRFRDGVPPRTTPGDDGAGGGRSGRHPRRRRGERTGDVSRRLHRDPRPGPWAGGPDADARQCRLRCRATVRRWLADRRAGGHVTAIAALLASGAAGLALLALPGTAPLVVGVLLGFGLDWSWPGLMNLAVVKLHPLAPAAATSITRPGCTREAASGRWPSARWRRTPAIPRCGVSWCGRR
jgi:MFS family permease